MDGEEQNVIHDGNFSRIGTSNEVFSDDECINDAQGASRERCLELGRRYHALMIMNGIGEMFVC